MSVTDVFNHCMNVNIIKSSYFVQLTFPYVCFLLNVHEFHQDLHLFSQTRFKRVNVLQNVRKKYTRALWIRSCLVSGVVDLWRPRFVNECEPCHIREGQGLPSLCLGSSFLIKPSQAFIPFPTSNNCPGLHLCNRMCRKSYLPPKQRASVNPMWSICFPF